MFFNFVIPFCINSHPCSKSIVFRSFIVISSKPKSSIPPKNTNKQQSAYTTNNSHFGSKNQPKQNHYHHPQTHSRFKTQQTPHPIFQRQTTTPPKISPNSPSNNQPNKNPNYGSHKQKYPKPPNAHTPLQRSKQNSHIKIANTNLKQQTKPLTECSTAKKNQKPSKNTKLSVQPTTIWTLSSNKLKIPNRSSNLKGLLESSSKQTS